MSGSGEERTWTIYVARNGRHFQSRVASGWHPVEVVEASAYRAEREARETAEEEMLVFGRRAFAMEERAEKAEEALRGLEGLKRLVEAAEREHGMTGELGFYIENGQWEVDYCVLDPKRNVSFRRDTLAELIAAIVEHDSAALASLSALPAPQPEEEKP